MGDNVGDNEEKGVPASGEYDDLPDDVGELQSMLCETKIRLGRARLELDVRQAILGTAKKDRAPIRAARPTRRRRRWRRR